MTRYAPAWLDLAYAVLMIYDNDSHPVASLINSTTLPPVCATTQPERGNPITGGCATG